MRNLLICLIAIFGVACASASDRVPLPAPGFSNSPPEQRSPALVRPQVVMITSRGCTPCDRAKDRLKSIINDKSVDYREYDIFRWNSLTSSSVGVTPTVFVFPRPGVRGNGQRLVGGSITAVRVRSILAPRESKGSPKVANASAMSPKELAQSKSNNRTRLFRRRFRR